MLLVKRLLKSSLKHFIGKYLKDKSLLDNLEVVGKQIELKNVQLDTHQIYETSKKYLHDSFNRVTVESGNIDSITVSLSSELIDNVCIDGVHLNIKTNNSTIETGNSNESVLQSQFIEQSHSDSHFQSQFQTDSIFAFEEKEELSSDSRSSESVSDNISGNNSPLKDLFSKSKRNISLIAKLLKQLGNVNVVITNVRIEIDDFVISALTNKICIRYNSNHPNELFPFDCSLKLQGLNVTLNEKNILSDASIQLEIEQCYATIRSDNDIKMSIDNIVIGSVIKIFKHITKPLKRIQHITKQFKQHLREINANEGAEDITSTKYLKTIQLDMKQCEINYPVPQHIKDNNQGVNDNFVFYITGLNGDVALVPKKTVTVNIDCIGLNLSKQTWLSSRNVDIGFTYTNHIAGAGVGYNTQCSSDSDSEESFTDVVVAQSPFESDKVRLFNRVVKPHPVAPKLHRQSYTTQTQKSSNILIQLAAEYTNIDIQSIKVVDELYSIINNEIQQIIDLVKREDNQSKLNVENFKSIFQESIFEKEQTFTIDTSFRHLTLKDHKSTKLQCIAEELKLFCCNRYWFGDVVSLEIFDTADSVDKHGETYHTSIGKIIYSSFAGSIPLQHLSLDAKKIEINDIDRLIEVYKLVQLEPDEGVFDFYFRIFKFCIYHNKFYIKLHKTEIFNAKDCVTGHDQINVAANKLIVYANNSDRNVDIQYKFLSQFHIVQYTAVITPGSTFHKLSINDTDVLYTLGTEQIIHDLIDDIKNIVSSISNKSNPETVIPPSQPPQQSPQQSIHNSLIVDYAQHHHSNTEIPMFKCTILKFSCTFAHPNSPRDQVIVSIKKFGLDILDQSIDVECGLIEVIDRLSTSVWNKAAKLEDIKISKSEKFLSFSTKKQIHLNIDQDIIMFFAEFMPESENVTDRSIVNDSNRPSQNTKPDKRTNSEGISIHMSRLDLNVNYKHKHTPRDSPFYWLTILNFIPIRDSKIHILDFDAFNICNIEQFYTQYLTHVLKYVKKDLGGLIKGIKPIKPITSVVAEGCKLILVPVNAVRGQSIQRLVNQVRNITSRTTVSVLEIGGSLQTADYYQHRNGSSVFTNQPKTIKDGLVKGHKSFTDGMTTIVTFITDDNADLFQLPTVLVKPFTGFLANTFLGTCNQIDPSRYQRMKDRYK